MRIFPPDVKQSGMSAETTPDTAETVLIVLGAVVAVSLYLWLESEKKPSESMDRFDTSTEEFKAIINNFLGKKG